MRRWGGQPCDGVMRLRPCSRCTLHGLGWNRPLAVAAGSLSGPVSAFAARFGALLERRGVPGKIPRLLRKSNRLAERHESVLKALAEVDHIVAVCDWARQVLLRNGVPQKKITLSRHGIQQNGPVDSPISALPGAPLRVACLARLDPMKGIDVLMRAVRAAPDLPIRLDIYAMPYGEAGERYETALRKIRDGDSRIAILPPLPPGKILPTLGTYDLLAVPSQCLETGPLVILEAFAARVPVIGSRLGGIAELVTDGQDGLLIDPANPPSWCETLSRLHHDRLALKQLRNGIRPPRTMREAAAEMLDLYAQLLDTPLMASA
jgi:glycosyltransferase involved in cell wall biosynthesis